MRFPNTELVGESSRVAQLREEIEYAARCDAKVLITGESGSGKEVVARLIHAASGRSRNPLVTINCAGIPETLLESELFGHARGSFTGAYRDKAGLLEQAHRGTVFMDEVGEMSLRMQGILLRFLETGEVQRVGGVGPMGKVDVRVIAATNRDLTESLREKTFREDLYYRLNVIHLRVPPLRDRREDVPALLDQFLRQFAQQYGVEKPRLSEGALARLSAYRWPGNVRELRNFVERIVVRQVPGDIQEQDLPADISSGRLDVPTVPAAAPAGTAPPATGAGTSRAEELYHQLVTERRPFWTSVYPLFMSRDMTRDDLRRVVTLGLEHTRGSYRMLLELFNMPPEDYKRFLNFLRKHQCHMPFQQFRAARPARAHAQENRREVSA